jgi:hypothetical protein
MTSLVCHGNHSRVPLMINRYSATFLASALFVAACGGGSSTSQTPSPTEPETPSLTEPDTPPPPPPTFEELLTTSYDLFSSLGSLSQATNMPASGTASFSGVAGVREVGDPDPSLLSEIALSADFSDGTIDGELRNFVTSGGLPITGTLDISNGVISGNTIDFDMNGVLSGNGTNATVSGSSSNAGFVGDGAQGVGGNLTGTFTPDGAPSIPVDGFFLGERSP